MHRTRIAVVLAAALMLVAAACQSSPSESPSESMGAGPSVAEPLGGSVSILASWTDTEQEDFLAMVQPWADANNVDVQYEGNRDLPTILTTRVEGGNAPDVAAIPGIGALAQFAQNGDLIDLGGVLDMTQMGEWYNEGLIDAGTVDGTLGGIFIKVATKGLVWYNPAAFSDAGYEVPTDWTSFNDLVEQIRSDGTTPWGIGLESGADSGWPGTDWIEDFMIRQSGPDKYDEWWQGTLPWSSPEVKAAFEAFGKWVTDPAYVFGGPDNALSTNFGNGADCLMSDPPGCYLHHQADFISSFLTTNFPDTAVAGDTYDFFAMPGESYSAATFSGDLMGMFNDTPQARSLIQWLVSPDAQAIRVARGGATTANTEVPLSAYPNDIARAAAEILTSADIARYDAGDLMPAEMGRAFFGAVLDYVNNPSDLDAILADMDDVQSSAYGQ